MSEYMLSVCLSVCVHVRVCDRENSIDFIHLNILSRKPFDSRELELHCLHSSNNSLLIASKLVCG